MQVWFYEVHHPKFIPCSSFVGVKPKPPFGTYLDGHGLCRQLQTFL